MKKIGKGNLLTLMLMLVLSSYTSAQEYKTSVGIRGGNLNGFSIKHFVSSNAAVEGIVASRWRGLHITGLYQIHATAFNTDRLKWYYGVGAHAGFYNGYKNHPYFDDARDYTNVGVDGILGLEYAIKEIPISISIDWKPEFNIVGYSGFWFGDGGLSIRYYW